MLGAFTLSGFAHLEKFYMTLDVPIERVNISAQQFLAYGAAGFGSFLAALMFMVALVGTIAVLLLFFEKPGSDTAKPAMVPKWIANAHDRFVENQGAFVVVGCICMLAVLLSFAWYLLVRVPSNAGRAAALELASECTVRQVVYANLNQYEGCLVAESEDMLYLLKRRNADSTGVEFHTLELPKSGLRSVTGQVQKIAYKK
jgi:hypothetical protein